MALSKKNILITGAGGFIGLNIVKTFASQNDWNVFALVHNNIPEELTELDNVSIIKGDVTSDYSVFEISKFYEFDIVVHAAGLASDVGPEYLFRKLNLESVKYVSKLAKEKFIHISTTDVYGIMDFIEADEDTDLFEYPLNLYPRYKIEAENWIKENCEKYVIIRPAAVYGNRDRTIEPRIVNFLKKSPFIINFGRWKGQNRWPATNVDNVTKTILAVATHSEYDNQAINIIDPKIITIQEYYEKIAKKYFPNKKFIKIVLPFWFGKLVGKVSTFISNISCSTIPVFDPTYYSVHHLSSNLDYSSKKMEQVLQLLEDNAENKLNK